MAAYEHPYREWDDDEKELLPLFLSLVGSSKRILESRNRRKKEYSAYVLRAL